MTTGKDIANRLGMHPTSLQKAGIGMAIEVNDADLIRFLETRIKPSGAWRPDKAAVAAQWYSELTGSSISVPRIINPVTTSEPGGQVTETKIRKPRTQVEFAPVQNSAIETHWLKSDQTMVTLLVIATGAQILHTSSFFYFITPIPGEIFRIITAILVGFAVDSAALIKTIRSGNRIYLIIFAIGHFFVNLSAHFRFLEKQQAEIDTTTWLFFGESCLLSFLVAFAVYSYSEAFAFKK
jgi:hypothetical protein